MATEKITLARVSHLNKDREGNPLTTKQGKPYTRCLIDTTDGRKMSGFGNQITSNWNEGMEVEVEVSESNGYLNFKTPKTGAVDLSEVNAKLDKIIALIGNETTSPTTGEFSGEPDSPF
jgi:hypothetical protein